MHQNLTFSARAWLALAVVACGSAEQARDALGFNEPSPTLPDAEDPARFVDNEAAYLPAAEGAEECAVSRVLLRETRRPIDVILVLDNSVSMEGELTAVERNINTHFANILEASGTDYRVILISRHRNAERTRSDDAKTSICITQPLSTLEDCPASAPGLSGRFFHYSTDIDSHDSLAQLLATYAQPDPLYRVAVTGWSAWLRDGARKVFLELTDDDSFTSVDEFLAGLTALAPQHFGPSPEAPSFVFHSIVGVAERDATELAYGPNEPLVRERCRTDERLVTSAGPAYQALSRLTGGLRFPLCHLDGYDAIFESIAQDGVERSGLSCSFPLPAAPPGKRLDLARLELVIHEGAAQSAARETTALRVPSADECQPRGFFADGDRIELCPALCTALLDQPEATVSAAFDCNAFVDVR